MIPLRLTSALLFVCAQGLWAADAALLKDYQRPDGLEAAQDLLQRLGDPGTGEPRKRIAWLQRLALDLPDEPEIQRESRRTIARLQEEAGDFKVAADTLGELAGLAPDDGEPIQIARARLLHRLQDTAGVAQVVGQLEQRWHGAGASITAARLWDSLGRTDQAQHVLATALAAPGLDPERRFDLALERIRLALGQGPQETAAACTAAAALVPAQDPRHDLLLAEAARRGAGDPRATAPRADHLRRSLGQERDPQRILAIVREALVLEFRATERAELLTELGDVYEEHGQGEAAQRCYQAALDLRPGEFRQRDHVEKRLARIRSWRGMRPRLTPAQDLVGQVDAADRACAGDGVAGADPVTGAKTLARLVDERGSLLWPAGDGVWQPISVWADHRRAAAGPALQAAWKALDRPGDTAVVSPVVPLVPPVGEPAVQRAVWWTATADSAAARAAQAPAEEPGRCADGALAAGDTLFTADGTGCTAYGLADGAQRWRTSAGDGSLPAFAGVPEHQPVQAGGLVFARVPGDGRWRLQAFRAGDGRPAWNSADVPALADLEIVSQPAAEDGMLVVLGVAGERLAVVLLEAASGQVLGRMDIPGERRQCGIGAWSGMTLTGHQPAPRISGGTAYCDTGAGLVAAVDLRQRRLRWLASYPRTVLGEDARPGAARLLRRGGSSPVLAGNLVVVAPRDSLVVSAFDPATGQIRWQQDLPDCRRIQNVGPDGVLLEGDDLTLVEAASGLTRWRWAGDAPAVGNAAVGATTLATATEAGVVRLALGDGKYLGQTPWSALGLDRPTPRLTTAGTRVVAQGAGRLAVLADRGDATRVIVAGDPGRSTPSAPVTPGPDLAVAAFVPGLNVQAVLPFAQDLLVQGEGSLLRYAPGAGRILWRRDIPPGARVVVDAGRIIVLDRGWYAEVDPADGGVVRSARLDTDPHLIVADDANCRMEVTDGLLTLFRAGWDRPIVVCQLAEGRTARVPVVGNAIQVQAIGGRLRWLAARDGGIWARSSAWDGSAPDAGRRLTDEGGIERWAAWPGLPHLRVVHHRDRLELLDLTAQTCTVLPTAFRFRHPWTWRDGDRLGLGVLEGGTAAHVGFVDPAAGTFTAVALPRIEPTGRQRPGGELRTFAGMQVVACARDLPGPGWSAGVLAQANGQDRWFRPFPGNPRILALQPLDSGLGVVVEDNRQGLGWVLLGQDGAITAQGWLPGSGEVTSRLVDGRWLVGSDEGLAVLVPGRGGLIPPTLPVAGLAVADPAQVLNTPTTALTGDLPARVQAGRTARALVLAVEVPGAETGELTLAVQSVNGALSRWRVTLDDGRTRWTRRGPGKTEPIAARVAWSPAGLRYELVVPWSAIAGGEAPPPATVQLCLEVTAGSRRAGLGLVDAPRTGAVIPGAETPASGK